MSGDRCASSAFTHNQSSAWAHAHAERHAVRRVLLRFIDTGFKEPNNASIGILRVCRITMQCNAPAAVLSLILLVVAIASQDTGYATLLSVFDASELMKCINKNRAMK